MKKIRTLGSDHTSKKNSNGLSCVMRCMNKKGTEANTAHLSFKITLKYYRLVHLEGERQLKESRMLILLSTWQIFILSLIYIRICREFSLGWNCTCINMVDVISRERRLMHCHGHSHNADILPRVDILKTRTCTLFPVYNNSKWQMEQCNMYQIHTVCMYICMFQYYLQRPCMKYIRKWIQNRLHDENFTLLPWPLFKLNLFPTFLQKWRILFAWWNSGRIHLK